MNDKEQKFVSAKLKGKSDRDAAKEATGTTNNAVATVQAHRLKKSPSVEQAITQGMAEVGITQEKVLQTISEAMTATKIIVMGKGTDDSFVDVIPDWGARLKAVDISLKLLGAYNQKPKEEPPQPTNQKELAEALDQSDEVHLSKVVFRKAENSQQTITKDTNTPQPIKDDSILNPA